MVRRPSTAAKKGFVSAIVVDDDDEKRFWSREGVGEERRFEARRVVEVGTETTLWREINARKE